MTLPDIILLSEMSVKGRSFNIKKQKRENRPIDSLNINEPNTYAILFENDHFISQNRSKTDENALISAHDPTLDYTRGLNETILSLGPFIHHYG